MTDKLSNDWTREIEKLKDERDGYRNGQQQMQDICSDLQDTIQKYAKERGRLIEDRTMLLGICKRTKKQIESAIAQAERGDYDIQRSS